MPSLAVVALAMGGMLSVAPVLRAQTTIAHWSFDSGTLSFDGRGNISGAADSTGNHNASVSVSGLGSAPASATFASSDSVSGKFGQALEFNGNNYMVFNNLTELMAANGAPSYTISLWVNSTYNNNIAEFAVMSSWGNAAAGNGATKYQFGFGFAGNGNIRSQTRYGTSGNGTDIYAQQIANTTVNDGSWHMLTWSFDTTAGVLDSYVDGSLVSSFTSTATSLKMANSQSAYADFGLKGDSATGFLGAGSELDEVWVFNGVLTSGQIGDLYTSNAISAVPEPGVTALVGLGLGWLSLQRFRKR